MINGPALSRCCPAPTASAAARSGTTSRSSRASLTGTGVELPGGTLPEPFGPWQTVRKRPRRFAADGIWDRIHAVLLAQADAAGGIDWTVIHHSCDGKGRPLAFIIGPGQGSDSRMFPHVIDAINVPRPGTGRARTRPDAVMGDKAYSSRANRSLLRARKIKAGRLLTNVATGLM